MSIYGFWQGPTYRPSTRDELFGAALEQPMSLGATFWDQAKGGVLESFGLGTAIRTLSLPPAAQTRRGRETDAEYQARQERVKGITEEEYKASPYYRDGVPWDSGMTEDRAAALATMYDAKRVREYFAEKRPITAFFGNLAGQATDPINYIPVAGPSVKAAAVARMGVVKGIAATAALDAAANTAIAGLATRETRRGFGDDVSWHAMVSEIATAALLGTAFGTVGGVLERRAGIRADALRREAEVKVNTLKATQEARIALNEAIGGLANDGEVRLSPNAVAPIERVAQDVGRAKDFLGREYDMDAHRLGQTAEPVLDASQSSTVLSEENAAKALRNAGYDLSRLQSEGQDVSAVMSAAPDKDAGLALQEQSIRFEKDRLARLEAATPTANSYGGGRFRYTDNAPADALVYETGMGGAITKAQHAAEISAAKARLGELMEMQSKGTPHQDFLDQLAFSREARAARSVDASPAAPEPPPAGRAEAEAKVAKPENYKALADQYRVDPEAGTFPEEAELRQLAQAGRLSDEDMAVLDDADAAFHDGVSYGEALKSVVGCLL